MNNLTSWSFSGIASIQHHFDLKSARKRIKVLTVITIQLQRSIRLASRQTFLLALLTEYFPGL